MKSDETAPLPSDISKNSPAVAIAVLVAALGYFVDLFDILLFSIIRVPSLKSLGFEGAELTSNGIFLLNTQMIGLLLGGIFWGILGDKKGRLYILFGSIFIYSIANIANGFVHSIESYALWRFVAGLGLAGELGAGITLVAEIMPKNKRGYGTTIIACMGISGAITAYFVSKYFAWQTAFFVGGGLGLILLFLRIGVAESGMFGKIKEQVNTRKGDFISLFTNWDRFIKYMRCIALGIPLWYVVGILITLSPEFGKILRVKGEVSAGVAIACCYGGMLAGDIISGLLSQYFKSRTKIIYAFLFLCIIAISTFFSLYDLELSTFYGICFLLGCSIGYMVLFLTISTEQFGTNIRATVTTTVPNFVRGSLVPVSLLFQYLTGVFHGSMINAAITVGILVLGFALWALTKTEETFSKDLDYLE